MEGGKGSWCYFALTLAFFLDSNVLVVDGSELPLLVRKTYKLVSGLQMERVPKSSSQFYEEYVPIVYQFDIPRWDKGDTLIYGSQNCNTTIYSKFFTTCPILYYLPVMHERFAEYLANNQPLVATLEEIGAKPEEVLIPFDCELVQPHFDDIYVDKVALDEYVSRLKSCSPLGSQEFIQGIPNYVYNISSVYFEMRRNFYSEYWLKIDLVDGRVDAAIWSNAVNVFNSLVFENYLMEAGRWKTAVIDCEAGRIPSTVLPPSLIKDTLSDMLESLSSQNIRPTVPTDTIGNYYKSSITDCTFTNDTFLVRILVPVIPEKEQFLLVKVSPVPFYYEESGFQFQCEVDSSVIPSSGANKDNYFLVDLSRNVAYESDCVPGKLCHIPTALHPRKISPCATAAFNWERFKQNNDTLLQALLDSCPIKCSVVNSFQQSIISHIAPSEFIWFRSNAGNDDVTVNCSTSASLSPATTGVDYLLHNHQPVKYGTQLFDIYCNCRLLYQSESYSPKPCSSLSSTMPTGTKQGGVQINVLAPVQWYDVKGQKKLEFWNVPEKVFNSPNKALIKNCLTNGPPRMDTSTSQASPFLIFFLTTVCLLLFIMVAVLGWKLHQLITQLQIMGFNVGNGGSYNVSPSNHGLKEQVSYRNMSSLVDNDRLLVNDDER